MKNHTGTYYVVSIFLSFKRIKKFIAYPFKFKISKLSNTGMQEGRGEFELMHVF